MKQNVKKSLRWLGIAALYGFNAVMWYNVSVFITAAWGIFCLLFIWMSYHTYKHPEEQSKGICERDPITGDLLTPPKPK